MQSKQNNKINKMRKSLKQSAKMLALFAFLSGCEGYLPNQNQLQRPIQQKSLNLFTKDQVDFKYDIRGNISAEEVEELKKYANKIPDFLQLRMNEYGIVVVVCDGNLTNNFELEYLKRKKQPNGIPWESGIGLYDPFRKKVFISVKALQFIKQHPKKNNPILHELSHAIEDAYGHKAYSIEFNKVYSFLRKSKYGKKMFSYNNEFFSLNEVFAIGLAWYIDKNKKIKKFPPLHNYFKWFYEEYAISHHILKREYHKGLEQKAIQN